MIAFYLISSPRHPVILGLSWLVMHNPIVKVRRQYLNLTTWMGKVIHDISISPGQVKPEDDHPAQVATIVEPSTSILSKYWEFFDVFEN